MKTYPWPTIASCFMLVKLLIPELVAKVSNLLAHTQHSINLLYSKPMKNIRHQGLESHILHAGNILRSFEILRGTVRSSLSRIVYKVLTYTRELEHCQDRMIIKMGVSG
jgi:hypothetical protein